MLPRNREHVSSGTALVVDRSTIIGFSDGIKFKETDQEEAPPGAGPVGLGHENFTVVNNNAAPARPRRRRSWCSWLFGASSHGPGSSQFVSVHGQGIIYLDTASDAIRGKESSFDETDFFQVLERFLNQ